MARLVLKAGLKQSRYRVSFRAGQGTFYDLPSPKPPIRTVMCRADTVLRVNRPYACEDREPIHVRHPIDQAIDIRLEVRGRLQMDTDVSVRVRGGWQSRCDTRLVLTRRLGCRSDTAQRIGRRLDLRADLEQTLFHVLLNETHLIAT
jgi:hypothetical protein